MYLSNSARFKKFEIMNRNNLKYIVIVIMFLDHFTYLFPSDNPISTFIRIMGRLIAPTMALFIAEGYRYTSDLNKYMQRLFIFGIISFTPFVIYRTGIIYPIQLFAGSAVPEFFRATGEIVMDPYIFISLLNKTLVVHEGGIILNLFFGLFAIYLWDKVNMSKFFKLIITLVLLWLAGFCNWHYTIVLLCLIFYFFRDNPKKMWGLYLIISLLYIFTVNIFENPFHFAFTMEFVFYKLGMFIVPFFFMLYNGESGTKSWFNKWFFYIFYPFHLILIGILRLFV